VAEDDEAHRKVAMKVSAAIGGTLFTLGGVALAAHSAWPSAATYGVAAGMAAGALAFGALWLLMHQRRPTVLAGSNERKATDPLPWISVVPAVRPGSTWHRAVQGNEPAMQLVGRIWITNLTGAPLRIVRVDIATVHGEHLADSELLVRVKRLHEVRDLPVGSPVSASFHCICGEKAVPGDDYVAAVLFTDERGRVLESAFKFKYL